MKKLPIELVENRKKYILFKNDCGLTDMTRRGGLYESYIFDYIKNNIKTEGTNIIDVGANMGLHTMEFADFVGDNGNVYSFEPQRIVFYQLCGNIILNGYHNVYPENIALSNEEGILLMENPNYFSNETINIGNSHLNAYTGNGNNPVLVKKLDSYNIDNISIIKIDVQGYEPNVLDGSTETINRNKPFIFIEVEEPQLNIYGYTSQDIFNRLDNLGYKYEKLLNASHIVDYVAYPK